jgi:type IV pilus biogenesis protein CpaD/CtpE
MMTTKMILALAMAAGLAACSMEDPPAPVATPATPHTDAPRVDNAPPPMPAPQATTSGPTAQDSKATNPTGALDKREEQNAMPMAGHGNNHSSPALDPKDKADPGRS